MPAPYDSSDAVADLLAAIHPATRIDNADAQAAIDELLSRVDGEGVPIHNSHALTDIYLGRLAATEDALNNWPDGLIAGE